MKTEFISYLSSLSRYTHGAALIQASKLRVKLAEKGELNMLLQLFQDYPLEYHHEKTLLFAIPLTQRTRWQGILLTLLDHDPQHTAYAETPLALTIKKLLADMLLNACVQLLDVNSQFKAEITLFFGFEKLMQAALDKKIIIYNVVYSYWMEIININLGLLAISADCNLQRLEALQKFFRALLRADNSFTHFFNWQMRQFEEVFSTDAFTLLLADLPADRISGRWEIHSTLGAESRLL